MWYVYILRCADSTLYTGSTNDLRRRIREHNTLKSGARYTKIRRPATVVYIQEYPTLHDARLRESEIKRLSREEKLKLITDLSRSL